MGSFSAQVSAWVAKTKERQRAVFQEAAQRVVEVMQTPVGAGGNMPVDTGFLRASLTASLDGSLPPLTDRPDDQARYSYDAGQVNLVIAEAQITDTIVAAYGARYSRYQEYGARGQPGRRFVALAAQQWAAIVNEVCREAQSRAK